MSTKQIFLNNLSTRLSSSAANTDTALHVSDPVPLLGVDEYYVITLDVRTNAQPPEIIKVTDVSPDGLTLTVARAQESTPAQDWDQLNTVVEMRLTSGSLNTLRSNLSQAIDAIEGLLESDDSTLDELQEVVNFIKANRQDLDALGISNIAGLELALGTKVDKVAGKQLSDENYSLSEKSKLSGIQAGAQVNPGDASTSAKGVTQYATGAETAMPSVSSKSVTPAGLHSLLGTAATRDVGAFDAAGTGANKAAEAVTAHEAKTDPHDQYYNASRLTVWSRNKEREALEAATGGACTIELTTNGQACHMFVLPKMTWEDLLPGQELGTGTHEAFIESGVEKSELLVGMYMAAELNGEMVSQPRTTGRRSINWDQSVAAAQASGFALFGNWEWSAVALWCMANGFQPRGNTDYGQSHSHPHERGVYDGDGSGEEYTLLGTGPNSWSHNNTANGIADLVGNRWEWVRGFKMVDGRILLAPDNDPTLAESAWVDTGWNMPGGGTWASQDSTGAPQSVKRALIMPNGIADPDGNLWTNLSGERFPFRGGLRSHAGRAGLGALDLSTARTTSGTGLGLRLSRLV